MEWKFLILTICCLYLLGFSTSIISDLDNEFNLFIKKYGKTYPSDQEYNYRYAIFKENVFQAMELNSKSKNGTSSFGVTKFSDLTDQEFSDMYLQPHLAKLPPTSSKKKITLTEPYSSDHQTPKAFNWASKGKVTQVKTGDQPGDPASVAIAEVVETNWAISMGNLQTLAQDQIADCEFEWGEGWQYVDFYGLQPQDSFNSGNCPNSSFGSAANITNYFDYNFGEPSIQEFIYTNGSVCTCLDAHSWKLYSGGMMTFCESGFINHCAQITGWFTAPNGTQAWIVRNDWGPDWGEDGYIWIEMGEDLCGISSRVSSCTI